MKTSRLLNILIPILFMFGFSLPMRLQAETVFQLDIDAPIHPVTMRFIEQAIERADKEGAEALVIRLDTPGGLMESMRVITKAILNSPVPVVVYVAPEGARAGSAGVFITLAAHIAAMAPGTNIGAATPVTIGAPSDTSKSSKSSEEAMLAKITNDAVAQARTLAERRGRNADWAEKAVREAASITATDALEKNVIDLIATSTNDLLRQIDGKTIETVKEKVVLHTAEAKIIQIELTWREKFLLTLANPNLAYVFLLIGIYGLIFEIYNPGAIIPGVVGVICLILAFFAFQTLPLNWAGLLLIIVAIVMFLLEVKVVSYGFLTLGGVVSLVIGSIMLFKSPIPALRVSWSVILPTVVGTVLFFLFAITFGIRAQRKKVTTGHPGMIGEEGEAVTMLNPDGKVKIGSEYWNATADNPPVEVGAPIVVTGGNRLRLTVRSRK